MNANRTSSLSEELLHQVGCLISALETAAGRGKTYEAFNPACEPYDRLTDRWPEDMGAQRIFIDELRAFAVDMERLRNGLSLPEMRKTLEKLFGERSAADSVRKFMDRQVSEDRSGIAAHIPSTGKVAAVASIATPSYARSTPRTSPWGD